MSDKKKVKFIRRKGKIVPIKIKASGDVDKRHVSNKKLATQVSKLKPKHSTGVKMGASFGILGALIAPRRKLGAAVLGAGLGYLVGSTRTLSKQSAANKLKRKFK